MKVTADDVRRENLKRSTDVGVSSAPHTQSQGVSPREEDCLGDVLEIHH